MAPVLGLDDAIESLREMVASGAPVTDVLERRFDLGLAWPGFPVGLGGRGLAGDVADRVTRRLAEDGLPAPVASFVGPHLVAPILIRHGTADQQELLRPTYTGEFRWCQLFSEPSAGSDLANVSTTATPDGDVWVVRGQKVWNSFAADATHGILLARSDPERAKHDGVSLFLVDMTKGGVEVRPLRDMTGVAHFNEVFLDEVVVHDRWRLGPVNEGWRIAIELLALERLAVAQAAADEAAGRQRPIEEFLAGRSRGLRGAQRDRYLRLLTTERAIALTEDRMVGELLIGRSTVDPIVLRVLAAEHNFDVLDLAMDVRGPRALLYDVNRVTQDGVASDLQRDYLYARGLMIGGGTLEICRNQIGERVLGLPAEPRIDKDRPWRETARLSSE